MAATLSSDVTTLRATLMDAEAEAARTKAINADLAARVAPLELQNEKMRRALYGQRSERGQLLIDQLELNLEELEASAGEDVGRDAELETSVFPQIDQSERALGGDLANAPVREVGLDELTVDLALEAVANDRFGNRCGYILGDVEQLERLGRAGEARVTKSHTERGRAVRPRHAAKIGIWMNPAGVRHGGTVPEDMIAQRLSADLRWVVAAAPSYIERYGAPLNPQDLEHHRCLGFRLGDDRVYRWEFEGPDGEFAVSVPSQFIIDDSRTMLSLALAGTGLMYGAESTIAPYCASGQLQLVLEDWATNGAGYHIYYSSRRQLPTGLRLLIDLIREIHPLGL